MAANNGHMPTVEWLLNEGGAEISDTCERGEIRATVWDFLNLHVANDAELSSLLRVIVLLADPPSYFLGRFKPQHARIIAQGMQLRAQLPAYIEQHLAAVVAHCPLPAVLQPIVARYELNTYTHMHNCCSSPSSLGAKQAHTHTRTRTPSMYAHIVLYNTQLHTCAPTP
jgi:hypothetical protein